MATVQRFYENKLPIVNELCVVSITKIDEMGVHCKLLEYGELPGFIPTPELSVARIRQIQNITKVGKVETVMVIRVDEKNEYIDLSKRRVDAAQAKKAHDRMSKSKSVSAILQAILQIKGQLDSKTRSVELMNLYQTIAWPLSRTFGHAYDAFKLALHDPDKVFKDINIDEKTKQILLTNIKRRLNPQPVKIRAEIQVTCYSSAGVIAIKDSLTKGVESYDSESIDGPKVDVHVKSAPIYSLETVVIDKQKGLTDLNNIRTTIEGQGGTLDVKMEPIVVSGETIDEQKNVNEDEEKTDDEEDSDEDSDEENEDDQKD